MFSALLGFLNVFVHHSLQALEPLVATSAFYVPQDLPVQPVRRLFVELADFLPELFVSVQVRVELLWDREVIRTQTTCWSSDFALLPLLPN